MVTFFLLNGTIVFLTSQNLSIMVKWSCYGEDNLDYFGILKVIVELEYTVNNHVLLFSCDWYEPHMEGAYDSEHNIVDVRLN